MDADLLDCPAVLALIPIAVGAFVATNLDDLVILTALFGSKQLSTAQIALGQYLGIAVLVGVSAAAAAGLAAVPGRWVGLFGVVPLALGIRGLVTAEHDEIPVIASSTFGVFAVVLADGADNVAVYVPLFSTSAWHMVVYVAVFAVLVAVWLFLGAFVASRDAVVRLIERWGRWIIPAVFIVIGVVLLVGVVVG
ncbi:MAG: cadmium transporter [Actinomycetia bacterium]|nr:cadmium transporter [Actinomycetes bacterium]